MSVCKGRYQVIFYFDHVSHRSGLSWSPGSFKVLVHWVLEYWCRCGRGEGVNRGYGTSLGMY